MGGFAKDRLGVEIRAYWDERAVSYSNGVRGELSDSRRDPWELVLERQTVSLVRQARADGRLPRALDLGCGPGFFEVLLGRMGWSVTGVDGSAQMIKRARANAAVAQADKHVSFVRSDFADLPFEEGTFDLVLSRNVTWLMREPEATYAEWLRVLRPGGKLLVFDANWYRYLVDPQVAAKRAADQTTNVLEGWDEDAQATSDEERRCEELAAELPLTPVLRPAWDVEVLAHLGATDVMADEDIWLELWPESERRYYGATPMFLVMCSGGHAPAAHHKAYDVQRGRVPRCTS